MWFKLDHRLGGYNTVRDYRLEQQHVTCKATVEVHEDKDKTGYFSAYMQIINSRQEDIRTHMEKATEGCTNK